MQPRTFRVKFHRSTSEETVVEVKADNPKQAQQFAVETVNVRTDDGEQQWTSTGKCSRPGLEDVEEVK